MNFQESLQYLYSLGYETLAMKFGLQNTHTLLAALGNPQQSFTKVQVVGTNGKGSTAAFLYSICRAANIKTGLFTSPHLISILERIKFDGYQIAETEFAALTSEVRAAAEKLVAEKQLETLPTFFEHLTALGLLAFARKSVELAVLETGIGGRLDSVTAAEAEFIGITSISFDHQEYLGNTLKEIAAEKAAVIHPKVRAAVISEQEAEAKEAIERQCAQTKVKPTFLQPKIRVVQINHDKIVADFHTEKDFYSNVEIALRGRHQLHNAATAIGLAEALQENGFAISREAIVHGLQTARHDGRLDLWTTHDGFSVLFDGAHNAAGARALKKYLLEFYSGTPLTMIFGAMRDKDLSDIAAELFPLATNLILTKPNNPRSAEPDGMREFASNANIHLTSTVAEAIAKARQITDKNNLICVTGSLYLVGEAQAVLSDE
jgi:dihydrofolate synthase / folylpolyglutamate synthase